MGKLLNNFDQSKDPQFIQDWKDSRERLFEGLKETASAQNEAVKKVIEGIEEREKMLFATQQKMNESREVISHVRAGFNLWIDILESDKPQPERVARDLKRLQKMLEEQLNG